MVAAIAVGGLLGHLAKMGAPLSGCMLLLVIIFLFGALTLAEPQQGGASGFPNYMFLLPVGNVELVAWPMVLSALALALAGGAIAVVVLGTVAPLSSTWWIAPYLAANVCMFQAISWLPLKRPELRVTLSFVTLGSIIAGPVAFGFGAILEVPMAIVYLALMLAAIAASVRGVGRARHGLAATGSIDEPHYRIPKLPPFQSRVFTQQWLEEKRNGLVMRVLTFMFLALFALIAIFVVPTDPIFSQFKGVQLSVSALGLVILALTIPPYFGFGGCCASEGDNIAKDRSLVPFLALRPLTTQQIIEAKVRMSVRMALKLALPSITVALAILLLPTSTDGHYRPTLFALAHALTMPQAFGFLALYGLVILGGTKAAVSGLWCNLGRLPLWAMLVISLVPVGLVLGVVARLVVHPDEIPQFIVFLPNLIWVLTATKAITLILATIRLRQSKLIPDAYIVQWFCGCAIAGVVLFAFANWAVPSGAYNRWAIAAQIFVMLPLCESPSHHCSFSVDDTAERRRLATFRNASSRDPSACMKEIYVTYLGSNRRARSVG